MVVPERKQGDQWMVSELWLSVCVGVVRRKRLLTDLLSAFL
jgi:hypothetical protein